MDSRGPNKCTSKKVYLCCIRPFVSVGLCTSIYTKLGERSPSKGRGPSSSPEKAPSVPCSSSRVLLLEQCCWKWMEGLWGGREGAIGTASQISWPLTEISHCDTGEWTEGERSRWEVWESRALIRASISWNRKGQANLNRWLGCRRMGIGAWVSYNPYSAESSVWLVEYKA